MAKAFKCDVCGKFYTEYAISHEMCGFAFVSSNPGGGYYMDDMFDLCEDCLHTLMSMVDHSNEE